MTHIPPDHCVLCPRLAAFRLENSLKHPDYHNKPVPSFGSRDARKLIVGLAPGLHGANQTGRPFTGDYAGDTLYPALQRYGLATGHYDRHTSDGLQLCNTRITNAVRCVPPQNKPTTEEIHTCRQFLEAEMAAMTNLRHILVLGTIAHRAVLKAHQLKLSAFAFGHGMEYQISPSLTLLASYHCSRYNTSTKRLTHAMFDAIIARFTAL